MARIAFLVNGSPASAMGMRAAAFAIRLSPRHDSRIFHRTPRKLASIVRLLAALARFRPDVCYVLDMAYSGVLAGALYRGMTSARLVIDTGDAITELAKGLGRGWLGRRLTAALEGFGLAAADHIVVRGTYHRALLARRGVDAEVIPDGVDVDCFTDQDHGDLRRRLGLDGGYTVGLVGSSMWNPRTQTCYGWDLVEALHQLGDLPVRGLMIGDGDGIPMLEARCRQLGLQERMRFLGRIPYERLPEYLGVMDICLSTQTNDTAGWVRTTGKLPLYAAAGRFVLASRVGEAARVLDAEMLVDFNGAHDERYPHKLAERIRGLLKNPESLRRGADLRRLARAEFDYDVLAARLERLLETL